MGHAKYGLTWEEWGIGEYCDHPGHIRCKEVYYGVIFGWQVFSI